MTKLALLCVAILAGAPREVSGQEPQLALQIRAEQDTVRAGDEISITFVITNVGTTNYKYANRRYDRSGRLGEYQLRAYDERGAQVPDPRTRSRVPQGYIGGGITTSAELPPGRTLSKTVALNLWAFVVKPGVYTVRGIYFTEDRQPVESPPLVVQVLPRDDAEMVRHIEQLRGELQEATDPDVRAHLVRRLMFTADERAALPLLELRQQDNNTAFWIGEAFSYFLPKTPAVLAHADTAIQRSGLTPSSIRILEQLGAPTDTIKQRIGESLIHADPVARSEAALAAQLYPDDRFMPMLIELATTSSGLARIRAIYALAYNRTDDGVATLRKLREHPDAEIRKTTEGALESAYRMSDTARGRPLRPDDFPDIVRRPRR